MDVRFRLIPFRNSDIPLLKYMQGIIIFWSSVFFLLFIVAVICQVIFADISTSCDVSNFIAKGFNS
jgi:hypothetical protein